ncbi:hypothetical protein [Sphingopyxis fribergensis]|uniref:hypothetical protein n=1 Tax=Sphingopyxis fribergensis TaxID=1515612 RepID=UPI0011DDE497|nr:hypothetical protein [Sphingopyxis fribergensis]
MREIAGKLAHPFHLLDMAQLRFDLVASLGFSDLALASADFQVEPQLRGLPRMRVEPQAPRSSKEQGG